MSEFQIRKDDFAINRVVDSLSSESPLVDGEILVKIDRFAFTANNITYAILGDTLGYWQFFPPTGMDCEGWGIIPVWGFADVVVSHAAGVAVGERLFGYFPPANYLKMTPTRLSPQRLFDGAAHRAKLPAGYNSYSRVDAEPDYDRAMDNVRMLLWPLHMTSFCLWDMLQDKQWFGAQQLVMLSASSKTSIGLAYALDADETAPPVVAVTSARNLPFVSQLGLYQQALTYDALAEIDATIPTVIVDMSGNGDVLGRLHAQLGDNMLRCIRVGLTHKNELQQGAGLNEARSEFFFAPGHIQMRMKDWGAEVFAARTSAFLQETAQKSLALLNFTIIDGLAGLSVIHPDVCAGRIAPDQGLIIQM